MLGWLGGPLQKSTVTLFELRGLKSNSSSLGAAFKLGGLEPGGIRRCGARPRGLQEIQPRPGHPAQERGSNISVSIAPGTSHGQIATTESLRGVCLMSVGKEGDEDGNAASSIA